MPEFEKPRTPEQLTLAVQMGNKDASVIDQTTRRSIFRPVVTLEELQARALEIKLRIPGAETVTEDPQRLPHMGQAYDVATEKVMKEGTLLASTSRYTPVDAAVGTYHVTEIAAGGGMDKDGRTRIVEVARYQNAANGSTIDVYSFMKGVYCAEDLWHGITGPVEMDNVLFVPPDETIFVGKPKLPRKEKKHIRYALGLK